MNIISLLAVFLGGGIGSVLRFATSSYVSKIANFPLATFLVNILGCFLIGIVVSCSMSCDLRPEVKNFLVAGFCGGLTTFSTFSRENLDLIQQGDLRSFVVYFVLSLTLGLLSVWAGYSVLKIRL